MKRPTPRMALALYGLGLLVFGLLAGWHPFSAELARLIKEHTLLRYR